MAAEHAWESGRIDARECMRRQARLLRASEADLNRFVDTLAVDDGLIPILDLCEQEGVSCAIASDGYDFVIDRVLARIGRRVPTFAGSLVPAADDAWHFAAVHARPDCRSGGVTCKCACAQPRGSILIGDGRSDFCLARQASFVFAKGRLAVHCSACGIPHHPIAQLADAVQPLRTMLRAAAIPSLETLE